MVEEEEEEEESKPLSLERLNALARGVPPPLPLYAIVEKTSLARVFKHFREGVLYLTVSDCICVSVFSVHPKKTLRFLTSRFFPQKRKILKKTKKIGRSGS